MEYFQTKRIAIFGSVEIFGAGLFFGEARMTTRAESRKNRRRCFWVQKF